MRLPIPKAGLGWQSEQAVSLVKIGEGKLYGGIILFDSVRFESSFIICLKQKSSLGGRPVICGENAEYSGMFTRQVSLYVTELLNSS